MKIRRKISIIFTIVTSTVLLCSFSFIYYLSYKNTISDFYARLEEKADFIAQRYFEKDELSKQVYEKIIEKDAKILPEAIDITLNVNNPRLVFDSLKKILPIPYINKLLSGKNIIYSTGEKQYVGIYYPDNQGTFIIVVTAVDFHGIHRLHSLLRVLIYIFFGSIILIYFIGEFYSREMLLPISHILKNVKDIRAANLKLRLPENNAKDELGELTRTFNQMLERLEHSFTMQQNFIHNASHELRNPLTAILGEAEVALSKERTPKQYVETLNKIYTEADRLYLLIRNLLNIAEADFEISKINSEQTSIDELLWEIKDYFDNTEYKNRVEFQFATLDGNSKIINGISSLLKTALINLIDNACKFSDKEKVIVSVTNENAAVVICVHDKGIGIPKDEMGNLFQPFFRASNTFAYKGSGIGLSLSEKIIKLHGGTIDFKSSQEEGTKVEVRFKL